MCEDKALGAWQVVPGLRAGEAKQWRQREGRSSGPRRHGKNVGLHPPQREARSTQHSVCLSCFPAVWGESPDFPILVAGTSEPTDEGQLILRGGVWHGHGWNVEACYFPCTHSRTSSSRHGRRSRGSAGGGRQGSGSTCHHRRGHK